jgi:hypothetical protein
VTTIGIAGVAVATFLPWVRSGEVERNSYEVARSAERLDLVDGFLQRALVVSWYLVPLACALVLLALARDAQRVAASVGLAVALLVSMVATLLAASTLDTAAGPIAALVAAVASVAGSVIVLVETHQRPAGTPGGT